MSFQIRDIVLYNVNGDIRSVSLEPGKVNIITGKSKTGKTALVEVIDYCLGSGDCSIPQGPMRQAVAWFAIRLQLAEGQLFVARRVPKATEKTTSEIYLEIGGDVSIPPLSALRSNIAFEALRPALSKAAGIGENLHVPPEGQTRLPLEANIRHALHYCFQPQYEIISPKILFHNQSEDFVPQAIKDTLPYFLGAVTDDHIAKRNELRRLSAALRQKEAKLQESEALRGDGLGRAVSFIAEARDVGLGVSADTPPSFDAAIEILRGLSESTVDVASDLEATAGAAAELLREKEALIRSQRRIKEQIAAIQSLAYDEQGYTREATEQVSRLRAIDMFKPEDGASHKCPLCQSNVTELIPPAAALRGSLQHLTQQLAIVSTGAPRLESAIERLRTAAVEVKQKLGVNRDKLEALRGTDERLDQLLDQASRRAHVLGRISLYLESVPEAEDTGGLKSSIATLQRGISRLKEELSDEQTKQTLDSFLNLIGKTMSEWASRLELEHSSDNPLRFDLSRLTIVADTLDGPVPMNQMGSGENWVGHHIIGHFAFHDWFTRKNRPVPRFLFLDQPSQVYFPAEFDPEESPNEVSDSDWTAVTRMFRLIFDFVDSLDGKFQLIITEHADLKEPWYQDAVRERWRRGVKLVPTEWLAGEHPASEDTDVTGQD
ncbi:DUF3732 domain-containing protein [Tautonia sociabilis]|uniref:DUF3732 domain-containing protein n=1 Tax=Tautonia sociabilis TaxID=2080755 RepID=A0A432MF31_9BACT|nr:DUF3732 domain-containing protein [Tautonia sociabilis]RUL84354.1 DUF3732 domain-containing protein [Tautonia sociabilis]